MPNSFTLHELTAGVWMAEAHGTASAAVSNAALVDLGGRTLVVDTFMTTRAAEELLAESLRLTGRAPYLVVNSHWHSDHIAGNRVYGDAGIVGTSRMRELIAEDAPKSREEFEKQAADIRAFAEKTAAQAASDDERRRASGLLALAEALISDDEGHRVVLPNVLVEDRLDLVGERRASILGYGRGHTESDLFVHLSDDDLVIAGDLVWTGVHPKTNDGFPSAWAAVLDRIAELGVATVISGHGPPGEAPAVTEMAAYMRELALLVDRVRSGSLTAADAEPPSGSEEWADESRFRASLADLAGRDAG
jgi:cyclase